MQMIQTTNYVARKAGVNSGMPGFMGKRLCPELVFIKPNYCKYRDQASKMRNVLYKYDSDLEYVGLDEADMDVT
jgi:DNA polymerase kappa